MKRLMSQVNLNKVDVRKPEGTEMSGSAPPPGVNDITLKGHFGHFTKMLCLKVLNKQCSILPVVDMIEQPYIRRMV